MGVFNVPVEVIFPYFMYTVFMCIVGAHEDPRSTADGTLNDAKEMRGRKANIYSVGQYPAPQCAVNIMAK